MFDAFVRLLSAGPFAILALACLLSCEHPAKTQPDEQVTVRVFAASSLFEAFTGIAHQFEALNPGVNVDLTFAGSQVLSLQIEHGANAHLFASADEANMHALQTGGLVSERRFFAHNRLTLVVPLDNPAGIRHLNDLGKARRLVVGSPRTPIGKYTHQLIAAIAATRGHLSANEIRDRIVSEESNTRLVRAKVELGEADAAIIYRTDVAHEPSNLQEIQIPESIGPTANYVIGQTARKGTGPAARASRRFIAYLLSAEGQDSLTRHGFLRVADGTGVLSSAGP